MQAAADLLNVDLAPQLGSKRSAWEFNGDRTDLHDVFSICWAAFLRASGLASPWLIDEDGWAGPEELSSRHLVIQPCSWGLEGDVAFQKAYKAMNAWSAFAFHLLDDVFDWHSAGRSLIGIDTDYSRPAASWVGPVLKSLGNPKDYVTSRRVGRIRKNSVASHPARSLTSG